MRTRRILFIALMIVMLLIGLYSSERIYYLLALTQGLILLFSLVTNWMVLYAFQYSQSLSQNEAYKGDVVTMTIRLHNGRPFPFPYLRLNYATLDSAISGQTHQRTIAILPGRTVTITEEMECLFRGNYDVGLVYLSATDLFGLFTISMPMSNIPSYRALQLKVTPRILQIGHLALPFEALEGRADEMPFPSEEYSLPADVRSYRYGDALKRVHWKLSSRKRELLIKQFEDSSQPNVWIFLDMQEHALTGLTRLTYEEQFLECAIAGIFYILSNWMPLHLIYYRQERQQFNGYRLTDFEGVYDALCDVQFDGHFAMEDLLALESVSRSPGSSLLLVLQSISARLFGLVTVLHASGLDIMVLLITPQTVLDMDMQRMIQEWALLGIRAHQITMDEDLKYRLEALR